MTEEELFLRNLVKSINKYKNKIKAIVINYPNNPTAKIVELNFYKELVKYVKKMIFGFYLI